MSEQLDIHNFNKFLYNKYGNLSLKNYITYLNDYEITYESKLKKIINDDTLIYYCYNHSFVPLHTLYSIYNYNKSLSLNSKPFLNISDYIYYLNKHLDMKVSNKIFNTHLLKDIKIKDDYIKILVTIDYSHNNKLYNFEDEDNFIKNTKKIKHIYEHYKTQHMLYLNTQNQIDIKRIQLKLEKMQNENDNLKNELNEYKKLLNDYKDVLINKNLL
jgi:hypothetical protein